MVWLFGRESGQRPQKSSTIRQKNIVCYSKTSAASVRLEPDIQTISAHAAPCGRGGGGVRGAEIDGAGR